MQALAPVRQPEAASIGGLIILEMIADVAYWPCALKARIISGGRFHPESCRLIWKLTSGSTG
jgi:hypothetical protein